METLKAVGKMLINQGQSDTKTVNKLGDKRQVRRFVVETAKCGLEKSGEFLWRVRCSADTNARIFHDKEEERFQQ